MKTFITLLIGCSLALAAVMQAAPQDPKKKAAPKSKPPAQQAAPKPQKQQAAPKQQKQQAAPKQHAAQHPQPMPNTHVQPKHAPKVNNPSVQHANVPKQQVHKAPPVQSHKVHPENNPPVVERNAVNDVHSKKMPPGQVNKLPAAQSNKLPAAQANKLPAARIDQKTVQNIRSQHVNFQARPRANVASVQFNQNYRIHNSQNWRGNHYDAFRSYHPEWHDRGWWHSHHNNIILIGGGWYFWNSGYWYPAWGYDTAAAYYPYDGPIYTGASDRRADQVIADVQAVLQQQGYYRGEVDGLLGPLTREAIAGYQRDQGLEMTEAIDQPTLSSLGLA